ncbi:MAG: DsbA family oxidoreductase [Gammaproteobacteria bacterium]|nr:DsbA family oxidoreductase [Gammaproteobacteria bacterium]NNM01905.1 DsbA family oxidoreductase [Gammaproteobacteria bacterium]
MLTEPDNTDADPGNADVRIDIVSDVVCPWCVIGYKQLEQALAQTAMTADIHWHPFDLNPAVPPGGENLREHLMAKYGISAADSNAAREQLTAVGAGLGFAFNYTDDMQLYGTFRAHQLLHWAEGTGCQHALKMALFDAFFTRHEDISDAAVLANIAERAGLDHSEALRVLEDQRFAGDVRKQQRFWIANGIQGVPAMIFNQTQLVTGARGTGNYVNLLRRSRPN